jgi:hypothetical protein
VKKRSRARWKVEKIVERKLRGLALAEQTWSEAGNKERERRECK